MDGTHDTGEGTGDDGETTEVTGLESGVLTGRTLTVVPVTDNDPADALGLVVTGNTGNSAELTVGEVLNLVGLAVGGVDGTNQHVVGDVVQVTTVLQPGTGHGDVVSGGLALSLDQDGKVGGVLAVPSVERLEDLETVRGRGNGNVDLGAVLRRSLVGVHARVVAVGGKTVTGRGLEHELVAILVLEGVGERVEVESTGDSHGHDKVGGGDEGVGSGVGIVTGSEVTVVRRDDRVLLALLDIATVPLSNARTASVGKNHTTELLEGLELTVTLNGSADLLGTGSDGEEGLGLDTVVESVTGNGSGTRHILVRGVGARSDKTDLHLLGPAVGLDSLLELADGGGKIGSEGTVDVRLKLGEVNLNELVILSALVLLELLGVGAREVTNLLALGGVQVVVHAVVEGEEGGGGTNLSTVLVVSECSSRKCSS